MARVMTDTSTLHSEAMLAAEMLPCAGSFSNAPMRIRLCNAADAMRVSIHLVAISIGSCKVDRMLSIHFKIASLLLAVPSNPSSDATSPLAYERVLLVEAFLKLVALDIFVLLGVSAETGRVGFLGFWFSLLEQYML